MTISRPKYEQLYWTLIWLGVSVVAWYLVYLKYLALDFHTRDYAFYTEFIIKWSKPSQEQYYSMNPGGYNFLGVNTVDGCDGFYQWVHFEPIRFVQAFIYKIFHSLHAVFAFNALVVCSPILGIGLWLKKASEGFWEKMIWALFFITFPATLLVAGYDNRPSMFLGVGYFWLSYFLLATKNKWGQYISFLLLFAIREEALILNGIVCLYFFFKWRRREVSADWFLFHLVTLIAYAIGLSSYFNYWNYELFVDTTNKYVLSVLLLFIALVLGFGLYILIKRKYFLLLFTPFFLFVFQLINMFINHTFPDEKFTIYNDPRILMPFLMLMPILLYFRNREIKFLKYLPICLVPLFIAVNILSQDGLNRKITFWKHRQKSTLIIFECRNLLGSGNRVVTDYTTHQCFLGFDQLYCYERLPCYVEPSGLRFYPENNDKMRSLINLDTWIVVQRNNMGSISSSGSWKYRYRRENGNGEFLLLSTQLIDELHDEN